jgi:Na+(H+)/acetate symporter ActP
MKRVKKTEQSAFDEPPEYHHPAKIDKHTSNRRFLNIALGNFLSASVEACGLPLTLYFYTTKDITEYRYSGDWLIVNI